jgi:hypothetical protein
VGSPGLSLGEDKEMNREAARLAKLPDQNESNKSSPRNGTFSIPSNQNGALKTTPSKYADKMEKKSPLTQSHALPQRIRKGIRIDAVDEQWLEGFKAYLFASGKISK